MAFVVTCWGYSPTGIHIGLLAYDPVHLALLRFLLASVFMAVVALCRGIRLPGLRDVPLLFGLGFFAVSLHHVAINFGQQGVSAGASSVLAQTTPLFSTLLARFAFKNRVSLWRWGCVLLGLLGVVIVVAGDHGLGSIDAHGLLILLAALSWSLYFALQKHHTGRYDGLTLVCYTVWSGTLLLLVFSARACGAGRPGAAARAAGGACPGDIPQCLGVSGLGLCAGTCGFESGDDDAVSGTTDGNGHCVVCAG